MEARIYNIDYWLFIDFEISHKYTTIQKLGDE